MKLSKQQFDQLLQKNHLVLSFIGMSNIGKTYWSKKLHNISFRHFSCDDLIEAKLGPILNKLGYTGIEDVSRWMGQPYDQRFETNQQKYLSLEQEVMEDIFTQVKNGKKQNTIIDTTGSVIHTNENICERLKQSAMVVYIEAPESMKEEMFKKYLEEPKPVVFGDVYNPKDNETETQTLSRCYRELLDFRSALYFKCADVIIPREAIEKNMNVQQFISLIKQSL